MIHGILKDHTKNFWYVMLSHEVNNNFLIHVDLHTKNNITKWGHLEVSFGNFADIEFSGESLGKLYNDFQILEENIDEIIRMIPLPKKIGVFDGYYWDGHISVLKGGETEFKKYFPEIQDEDIQIMMDDGNLVNDPNNFTKEFTKKDMLLIISIIKKKILEAKDKGEILLFSGD